MARKRSITSAMGADERIEQIACDDQMSAMMWPWLLTAFDDWGRLDITSIGKIRLEIFPAFPKVKNVTIEKAITAYVSAGIVHRYADGERSYVAVRPAKWMKWQTYLNGTKRASAKASIPAPNDAPWNPAEDDSLVLWLTRAEERGQIQSSADVGECRGMSVDIGRHSGLSVPSPSPSSSPLPSPSTSTEKNDGVSTPAAGHDGGQPVPMHSKPDAKISEAREIGRLIDEYTDDDSLRNALHGWIAARKKIKKPPTARAVSLALKTLSGLASDTATRIAIVDQAVLHSWQSFYPLKDDSAVSARASPQLAQSKADQFRALAEELEREEQQRETG